MVVVSPVTPVLVQQKWFLADIRNTLVRDLRSDEPAIQGRELEPSDLPDYIDLISARTEFLHPSNGLTNCTTRQY
jgi:hypothetical protein